MNEVIRDILTKDGLSTGRIGFFLGLFTVVGLSCYDTYINKKLDLALAGLLLSAGTVGYGITKQGEKQNV